MILLVAYGAVALVSGAGALHLLGLRPGRSPIERGFFAILALASGLALGSCLYFLQRAIGLGSSRSLTVFVQCVCAAGLLAPFLRRARPLVASGPGGSAPVLLLAVFAFLAARAGRHLANLLLLFPMGRWDAFPVWNLHARLLYRGDERWTVLFDKLHGFSHPDYPLLLPAAIANGWTWLGRESAVVPALLGAFFTVATVVLLLLVLWRCRSPVHGLLAGMSLCTVPFFVELGAAEMADVPLGFWMLATFSVLLLSQEEGESNGFRRAALAGLFAGFAAWTKNEGVAFFLMVGSARFVVLAATGGVRRAAGESLAYVGGAAPALLSVAVMKFGFAPPSEMVLGEGSLARVLDLGRHETIFYRSTYTVFSFGRSLVPNVLPPAVGLLILGIRSGSTRDRSLLATALALALVVLAYFFTYATTPHALAWQMKYSIDRLCIQLWPSLLLLAFASMADPAWATMPLSRLAKLAQRLPMACVEWIRRDVPTAATLAVVIAIGFLALRVVPSGRVFGTFRGAELTAQWYAEPVVPPPADPAISGFVVPGHGALPALAASWGAWQSPGMPRSAHAARWLAIAFVLAIIWLCVWMAREIGGAATGLAAAIWLATLSTAWGGEVFQVADVPAAAFHAAQLLYLLRIVRALVAEGNPAAKYADFVAFGAASGLALGSRPIGMLPFAYLAVAVLVWAVVAARTGKPWRQRLRSTLAGAGLSVAFAAPLTVAFWPFLSIAPGAVLSQLAAGFAGEPANAAWLVGGRVLLPADVPVSFWAVVLASAASLVGGWALVRRAADTYLPIAVLMVAVSVPALYVLLRGGAAPEVARVLVFVLPALAIGAAFGVSVVASRATMRVTSPQEPGRTT